MMKLLMSKTFYEIDHEYYQAFNEEITHQCGATLVCLLVIDCRAYVFNLGDCKGYLYRS